MAEETEKLAEALACHQRGDWNGAQELYRQVLRLNPDNADALYLFGCLAYQTGNSAAACELLRKCVQVAPRHARAWYDWGCEENKRGEFVQARECFARAWELEPDWLEARHNLGRALYELGFVSEAFGHFQACAEMERPGSEQSRAMMAVIVPGVPEQGNAGILNVRRIWAERALPQSSLSARSVRHNPLRVGYVSSFFQRDNWMKPVWGLINQHDRDAVQVHLFSDCPASAIQHGYQPHAGDRYFDTSALTNEQMAALIAEAGVDVLVDLNGYSNMKRLPLFAHRPAPVLIGWFNMYATTGMAAFDYLIGDAAVVPEAEEPFYTERILRVQGSYLTFDVSYPVPPVVHRSGKVFGALASQYKITDQVIQSWCRILHGSPGSFLLVKNKQMGSAQSREFFAARFAKCGIGPDRLLLEGPEPHYEFLRAYDRIDIALDTFPYNGGTTTTEALWQGVPVVTFHGDRWASRTSASLLRAAGLGKFIAANVDEYVELAIRLAQGAPRLTRGQLLATAVCDTIGFARQMEALYENAACNKLASNG